MSYPTPPPFQPMPEEKPSPAAWLIPVAGLLALVGAFTPWFKPNVTAVVNGRTVSDSVDSALYSWKDGKIGLIAPILLVLLGIGVVGLLRGRTVSRFHSSSHGSVVAAARGALIAGAVSLVAVIVAWFLLPHQYKFTVGASTYSWDDLQSSLRRQGASSVDIGHGPQVGYWLTIAAAVLALIGGGLMLAMRKKVTSASAPAGFKPPTGPPMQGYPAQPGLGQISQGGQYQPAYQPPPATQPPAYEPPSATQPPAHQPPSATQPPAYQPQHGQPLQFVKDNGAPPVQH